MTNSPLHPLQAELRSNRAQQKETRRNRNKHLLYMVGLVCLLAASAVTAPQAYAEPIVIAASIAVVVMILMLARYVHHAQSFIVVLSNEERNILSQIRGV